MKMEKVIYNKAGGLGIILSQDESESDFIEPKDFVINDTVIKTDTLTDLLGMFTEPVRFAGVLKDDKNCMCFMLGKGEGDLFDLPTYYSCFYWISESRIANKYKEGTVRDFNWINGTWK